MSIIPPVPRFALLCLLAVIVMYPAYVSADGVGRMTLEEAVSKFKQIDNASAPTHDFIKEAIAAQRLDILQYCWEKVQGGGMTEHFLDELKILPDSKVKNGMVLIILKSPTTNLLYADNPTENYFYTRIAFAKSLLTMIRKTIPDVPLDYEFISTYEKRLTLARAMEKALGIEPEHPEDARRVWPPKPGEKPVHQTVPLPVDAAETKPEAPSPVNAEGKTDEHSMRPNNSALWGGIAAVLASIASWLIVRSRSKKR